MNAVNGTIFAADIPIFPKGAYSVKMYGRLTRNAVPVGEAKVKAIIATDGCYSVDDKHGIYFRVRETDSPAAYAVGKPDKKQGKHMGGLK